MAIARPKDAGFRTFSEFYPFYLSEHRHPVSRVLHYLGTWGSVICIGASQVWGAPVEEAQPLPYAGFEPVFNRTLYLNFRPQAR